MEKRGLFITLEGIEGCGKTTQQRLLVAHLAARGLTCLATKQPGGTAIGGKIREILLSPDHHNMAPVCEALLYLADRAQHHAEVIEPALSAGTWVICDRYQDSTVAYQGAARGVGQPQLDAIFNLATGGLKPDVTLLLDLSPETGLARARARNHAEDLHNEGRFEEEAMAFHTDVRAAFLEMAEKEPDRFIIVNADQSPEAVAVDVAAAMDKKVVSLV